MAVTEEIAAGPEAPAVGFSPHRLGHANIYIADRAGPADAHAQPVAARPTSTG